MFKSRPAHRPWTSRIVWSILGSVWLAGIAWGIARLNDFSFRPGESGEPATDWPQQALLTSEDDDRMTLVVALHAGCACSRATVEELNKLCAERPNALHLHALFVNPPDDAEASEMWHTLRRIPGANLVVDADGTEARRFALRTSGEVRVYGADGVLRFHGGITISRGHIGANPGSAAIVAAIDAPRLHDVETTPVFGCALFDHAVEARTR